MDLDEGFSVYEIVQLHKQRQASDTFYTCIFGQFTHAGSGSIMCTVRFVGCLSHAAFLPFTAPLLPPVHHRSGHFRVGGGIRRTPPLSVQRLHL